MVRKFLTSLPLLVHMSMAYTKSQKHTIVYNLIILCNIQIHKAMLEYAIRLSIRNPGLSLVVSAAGL